MCSSCQKRRVPMNSPVQPDASEELVKVIFQSGRAKIEVFGQATRTRYGQHAGGDVIEIKRADAVARPDLFRLAPQVTRTQRVPHIIRGGLTVRR